MEAGFAGRERCKAKLLGAGVRLAARGGGGEAGIKASVCFLNSLFFLVLQTQAASHSGHQQDRRGAHAFKRPSKEKYTTGSRKQQRKKMLQLNE